MCARTLATVSASGLIRPVYLVRLDALPILRLARVSLLAPLSARAEGSFEVPRLLGRPSLVPLCHVEGTRDKATASGGRS